MEALLRDGVNLARIHVQEAGVWGRGRPART